MTGHARWVTRLRTRPTRPATNIENWGPPWPTRPIELDTLFRLDGQVAFVTGASTGIGKRLAQVAAAAGAKVVLVGARQRIVCRPPKRR